ncbi:MAG: hypothetical protein FWE20_12905, partial [Defluviitaleaceae bacterium]|nr:hypothetical protein [Defluviitaleaceae bacterium]
ETIMLANNSVSRGQSPSYSRNEQKLGKDLLSTDELAILDGSKCILQLRGVRPFLSSKYDITQHKNYRHLSDANPKYAFDVGKHIKKRLKVKPTEEYEYFEYIPADEEMPQEALSDFGNFDEVEIFTDFPDDLEPI